MKISSANQKNELFKHIWNIAEELRGKVDGWDFKGYVLGFLFYKYISENLCQYINKTEWESGNKDFDYALCKGYVKVFCRNCGASADIPAMGKYDAEKFLECSELNLK